MVPKGWASLQLGKIMSFKNGLNFTKTDNGDSIKIVGVGDFKDFTELSSTEHLELISVAGRIRDEELLNNGDLLFVRSNGNKDLIGRCMFFPEVRERLSFSGFTIRGRVINEAAFPAYMAIVARSSQFQTQISKASGGTNISNLSQQILNDINLLLPPLIEQKKIAQILSTWDKAISVTEKLLTNSQQQKKALMQQLLSGKKRLLDENGVMFSGEWEVVRLKQLIHEEKKRNRDNHIQRVLSVTNHSGFVSPEEQFSKRVASEDVSTYKIVKKNQYGYNPSRLNVGSFARLDNYDEGVLSPMYVVFSINHERLNSDYFLNWMSSNEAKQRIAGSTQGSVRDSVGFDALCSFSFSLPTLMEQQKIAAVLSAADAEMSMLEKKLACLKEEKKALMQQLLTGKRRVNVESEETVSA
ncbi:restriction endonuclease subunit S [Escherichia coli]|nr:restriction endonuclease subunit S [Escherichia coli]ELO5052410.1 restriction endonuclease subunit S [Escherichia coli]